MYYGRFLYLGYISILVRVVGGVLLRKKVTLNSHYDVVMVMPGMGKTFSSERDKRFYDLDTFYIHYDVPEHLRGLPLDKLKGHNDLVERSGWIEEYLTSLENTISSGVVPLVNSRKDLYWAMRAKGYRILLVFPSQNDYQIILNRLIGRNRKGLTSEEIIEWFDDLYSEMTTYPSDKSFIRANELLPFLRDLYNSESLGCSLGVS